MALKMETNRMKQQSISELLQPLMVKVTNNSDFMALNHMANLIDLSEINRKINSQQYVSFNAFLVDIKTMFHNACCTSNEQHKIRTYKLEIFCTKEIENISSCADCYKNMHIKPNQWQSLACSRPHLVLWVELKRGCYYWPGEKGYSYWPAKLISIGRKNVKAIYFSGSEFVEIPRSNCFIFSTNEPTSLKSFRSLPNPKDMLEVLEMVNSYGQNIKDKFGRFESTLECVCFGQLDAHMRAMFPEYTGSSLDAQNYYETIDEATSSNDDDDIESDDSDEYDTSNQTDRLDEFDETRKNGANDNDEAAPSSNESDEIPTKRQRLESNIEREFLEITGLLQRSMEKVKKIASVSDNTNRLMNRKMRQELGNLKKLHGECQAQNDDLRDRLKTASDERDQSKTEAAKIQAKHNEEITALKRCLPD
ncbi:uncharacterized protein LOC129570513 [Sitodiplosis mosellana]|uniref:uncharacterized protein LOC129570513 n=1 Tax=Sitodiplosis mosellana TaxID=263140 RepID=UPI002444CF6F|nr:uncharacterized protein LOC129570513 [Sitodiplosis mosellana]